MGGRGEWGRGERVEREGEEGKGGDCTTWKPSQVCRWKRLKRNISNIQILFAELNLKFVVNSISGEYCDGHFCMRQEQGGGGEICGTQNFLQILSSRNVTVY